MEDLSRDYTVARWRFNQAVRERSFDEALERLRDGLRVARTALPVYYANHGSRKPVVFLTATGGAVAALFNDAECFDLMDDLAKMRVITQKVNVAQYRQDGAIIKALRDLLAAEDSAYLSALSARFKPTVRHRVHPLLKWMVKIGEISLIEGDKDTEIILGVAPRTARELVPTFRRNSPIARSKPIAISHLQIHAEVDFMERESSLNKWATVTDAQPAIIRHKQHVEIPLAMSLRQPSVMRTHSTAQGTWLVAKPTELPDRTYSTFVNRYSPSGDKLQPVRLPHSAPRLVTFSSHEHFITYDDELDLRVYNFDGNCLFATSLWETPEVLAVFDEAPQGLQPSRVSQQADVRINENAIAFSVADKFWVFTLDGELILGGRVPAVPDDFLQIFTDAPEPAVVAALKERGLSVNLRRRQIAGWLDEQAFLPLNFTSAFGLSAVTTPRSDAPDDDAEDLKEAVSAMRGLQALIDEVGGLRRDWISLLRFTDDGSALWIGTQSSLLMRVGLDGEIVGIWSFEKPIKSVFSAGVYVFAVLPTRIVKLTIGEVSREVVRSSGKDVVVHGDLVARRDGRAIEITDVKASETLCLQVHRDFRALIPNDSGFRIETKTTFVDVGN